MSDMEILSDHLNAEGPTNLEALADDLGIAVFHKSLNGMQSSSITIDSKHRFTIVIDENYSKSRQRFALAFEIARYVASRDVLIKSGSKYHPSYLFNDDKKGPVTYEHGLAIRILMPINKIKLLIERGVKDISVFAKAFDVTTEFAKIRMRSLSAA